MHESYKVDCCYHIDIKGFTDAMSEIFTICHKKNHTYTAANMFSAEGYNCKGHNRNRNDILLFYCTVKR